MVFPGKNPSEDREMQHGIRETVQMAPGRVGPVFPQAPMPGPSAPAAVAASAMGLTIHEMPVAWLGSTITGRWVSFFSTGMAAMSRVARLSVSKVRMPRSHRITCRLPPARIYSAACRSSVTVADMPRFSSTGFLTWPRAWSRAKFCIFRAPTCRIST